MVYCSSSRAKPGLRSCAELRHGDQPRGNLERPADEELPDEQERHQPAPAIGAVAFEQIEVGPAGAGHGGRQLAPDQAVQEDQDARRQPAQQGIGPGQLPEHQRNGDEDAGADDQGDIQCRGLKQAEMTGQAVGLLGRRLIHAGPPLEKLAKEKSQRKEDHTENGSRGHSCLPCFSVFSVAN